ncbi:MAG: septum formation family protein [Acidimicrobiales bacterium]
MSQSPGPGWWLASDGKWYPPHLHPDVRRATSADAHRRTVQPPVAERRETAGGPEQTSPAAGSPAPAPLGDPTAPLPQRAAGPAPAATPTAATPPAATPPAATPPATGPPAATPPTTPPPAVAPTGGVTPPQQPPTTPPLAATAGPGPEQPATAPPGTPVPDQPARATGAPVVRWNSEQSRQPTDSTPAARGPGPSRPDDSSDDNALIPLPDLEDEPPPVATPKSSNKAPTLADTLLGARATTPEAALPGEPLDSPTAERWVRPEAENPPVETGPAPRDDAPLAAAATLTETDPEVDHTTELDEHTDETEELEEAADTDRPKSGSDRAVNIGVVLLAVVLAVGAAYFLLRDDSSDTDTAANERAVADLTVGDCFGGELLGSVEVELVPIVDCATPHQYEVFYATDFAPDDAPFDAEAIREQATTVCIEQLESVVGVPIAEAPVQLLLLNPTRESWRDDNDRTTLCLAYDPAGPLRDPIGS